VSRVRLRPLTSADADLLNLWQKPPYVGEFNRFGMPARPVRVNEDRGALIVELVADGTPIGSVSWHAVMYGPNPESAAMNIGINLIPDWRGQGLGTEAQLVLAEMLFATTAVNRIEAMTDVENVAEQRSLEKAGFRREGVLYGAQFRGGVWHDIVVFSMVRRAVPTIGQA